MVEIFRNRSFSDPGNLDTLQDDPSLSPQSLTKGNLPNSERTENRSPNGRIYNIIPPAQPLPTPSSDGHLASAAREITPPAEDSPLPNDQAPPSAPVPISGSQLALEETRRYRQELEYALQSGESMMARPPPPDKSSLSEMLEAAWPDSGFLADTQRESPRLVCSINRGFKSRGCSFCGSEEAEAFKEEIKRAANWLKGHHTRTSPSIHLAESHNYANYLDTLEKAQGLAAPFLPPVTAEEIEAFKAAHGNVSFENEDPDSRTGDESDDESDDELDQATGSRPMKEKKGSKFYFYAEGVHLTFAYHLQAEPYLAYITAHIDRKSKSAVKIDFYTIVQEVGKKGHKHTHVGLLFNKKLKHESKRFFDYMEDSPEVREANVNPDACHPNVRPIKAGKHESGFQTHYQYFANVVLYHRKQGIPVTNVSEEDLKGMQINQSQQSRSKFGRLKLEDLMNAASKKELIQVCLQLDADPRDVPKLITAHAIVRENTDSVILREVSSLSAVQEFLLNYARMPDDRTIIWVADPQGGTGKTYLATYMAKNTNTLVLTTTSSESASRTLKNHIDRKGAPEAIVFDLARSTLVQSAYRVGNNVNNAIYRTIETLKSQFITSTKYDSTVIEQKRSPGILVLSNSMPDINMLTLDRWVLLIPGVLPNTFDYCFHGDYGKLSLDMFSKFVEELRRIHAEEEVEPPTITIPIRNTAPIIACPSADQLSLEYRRSCWDRGVCPVFHARMTPPSMGDPAGHTEYSVTEEPLTSEEVEKYNEWKSSNGSLKSRVAQSLEDMELHMQAHIEAKLLEYRKSIQNRRQQLPPPEEA